MKDVDLQMPVLEEGRIYSRDEVKDYICVDNEGSNDFNLMFAHFPRNLNTFEFDLEQYRRDEAAFLQYQVFSLGNFAGQIQEIQVAFDKLDALRQQGKELRRPEMDRDRVRLIIEKLQRREMIYPVFIQKNDPQRRIIEGMHRIVALWQLGSPHFPAYLVGYRDWFLSGRPSPEPPTPPQER